MFPTLKSIHKISTNYNLLWIISAASVYCGQWISNASSKCQIILWNFFPPVATTYTVHPMIFSPGYRVSDLSGNSCAKNLNNTLTKWKTITAIQKIVGFSLTYILMGVTSTSYFLSFVLYSFYFLNICANFNFFSATACTPPPPYPHPGGHTKAYDIFDPDLWLY